MAKKASSELGKGFLQNKDVKALSENLFKPGDTKSVKSMSNRRILRRMTTDIRTGLLSAISTEFMKPETSENKRSPVVTLRCPFGRQ